MAKGDSVASEEEVVRALHYPFWDAKEKRATPSAFMYEEVSVGRTAVVPYEDLVKIFRADLDGKKMKDGTLRTVQATASLTVARILSVSKEAQASVLVSVVEDPIKDEPPLTDNPAHALIVGKDIKDPLVPKPPTRGMANKLLGACTIRSCLAE